MAVSGKTVAVVVGLAAALAGGAVVVDAVFAPEESTVVNETDVEPDSTLLAAGNFSGTPGHEVSGTVELREDDEGYYLRFENYTQTQGPDVYVYLTPSPTPDTQAEIDAGVKVRIDGGADDGQSTKEGTFTQRLDEDLDPGRFEGVAIWCDDFSVLFGSATLNESG